ncbi:MAG: 23S rRNA (adenine(2503)-C(2))-methyltransferase RlmN [Bacteroides sp.]|nr:23S rRNA (adenine(2503)-C(2))-methyltransferase RlmN [Eubacterium sp.]MCM1418297.1 23S rRNA (adenine(2503)-C(2))-methyltransferase RlmN [Roseburia sp.]MCM1462400.1 23S rRNA (adenine(2503)-C(2))-methyltransferase RlmN [Bacteroides sp.]
MNIYDLPLARLIEVLQKKTAAETVFRALYRDRVPSLSEIPLKPALRSLLEERFTIERLECAAVSDGENAVKYLFRLSDGHFIESVLMRHEYGNNICISTQVGCNMGCAFCRSGRMKKIRNLSVGEMLGQILAVGESIGEPITGLAVMGIGEPFDNYENVLGMIDTALYQNGLCIGSRHITVSTCGVVPRIEALSKTNYNVNLAVSLHAPDNALRSRLMPINRTYPLEVLIPAIKRFSKDTNRRVTLEYVMLKNINDGVDQAKALADLIGESKCYVNIIRYNPSEGDEFERSDDDQIFRFYDILKKNKIGVTMRREMGAGVNAACGQLRGDYEK